jgi:hypothetical protein
MFQTTTPMKHMRIRNIKSSSKWFFPYAPAYLYSERCRNPQQDCPAYALLVIKAIFVFSVEVRFYTQAPVGIHPVSLRRAGFS